MPRTPPSIADLHPWLQRKVYALSDLHEEAHPDRALALIWGHRTPREQYSAYVAGRSKLDGRRKYSLHNYLPSLAADLWVYLDATGVDGLLYEGRPPRGQYERLCLLQRGDFKNYYLPLAKLGKEVGLEAGAFWRRLKDGPHFQLPRQSRLTACQQVLRERGFYQGALDGIIGPRSLAAILDACDASGINGVPKYTRLMPMTPDLWAWLHRQPDSLTI